MSLSHNDIAHNWAHQVRNRRDEIAGSGGNMLYDGDKIYSYGKHFCIARMLPGNKVVVFGKHTYSPSTGRHQYLVRRAISHLRVVECHDPDRGASYNRTKAKEAAESFIDFAATTRRVQAKTRLADIRAAGECVRDFNEYLAALPEDEREGVAPLEMPEIDETKLSELRKQAAQREERDRLAKEERERAYNNLCRGNLSEWRRHMYQGYDLPTITALRLSKDKQSVETSKGAHIPVSHAKRLWPIIVNCRAVGKGLIDRDIRLGHFILNEIRPDGSIVVGCHDIPYAEIELIARELGLLTAEVMS